MATGATTVTGATCFDHLCTTVYKGSGPKPDPRRVAAALLLLQKDEAQPGAPHAHGATYDALARCGVPQEERRAAKQSTDKFVQRIAEKGLSTTPLPDWVEPAGTSSGRKRTRATTLESICADACELDRKIGAFVDSSSLMSAELLATLQAVKRSLATLADAGREPESTCDAVLSEAVEALPDNELCDDWLRDDWLCGHRTASIADDKYATDHHGLAPCTCDEPPPSECSLLAEARLASNCTLLAIAACPIGKAYLPNVVKEAQDASAAFGAQGRIAKNVSPEGVNALLTVLMPRMLLFSGHGDLPLPGGGTTLAFVGACGQIIGEDPAAIAKMFGARGACHGGPLQVVFLNGCHTAKLAKAVHDAGVPVAVGWRTKVHDFGARYFAKVFFGVCATGQSYSTAFVVAKLACTRLFACRDPDDSAIGGLPALVVFTPPLVRSNATADHCVDGGSDERDSRKEALTKETNREQSIAHCFIWLPRSRLATSASHPTTRKRMH